MLSLPLNLTGSEHFERVKLIRALGKTSKSGPEQPVVAASKARGISKSFTENALGVEEGGRSITGRQQIAQAIGWVRETWARAEVRFEDLVIELESDERAVVTGRVRVSDPQSGQALSEDGNVVRLDLSRAAGPWRIERAWVDRRTQ